MLEYANLDICNYKDTTIFLFHCPKTKNIFVCGSKFTPIFSYSILCIASHRPATAIIIHKNRHRKVSLATM